MCVSVTKKCIGICPTKLKVIGIVVKCHFIEFARRVYFSIMQNKHTRSYICQLSDDRLGNYYQLNSYYDTPLNPLNLYFVITPNTCVVKIILNFMFKKLLRSGYKNIHNG